MKFVAVVQARIGSTRLPGKSLLKVWREMSLLEMVLCRVKESQTVGQVVLAIPDLPEDEPLADLAFKCGVEVCRGSETDLLNRFAKAAANSDADAVVRVCADGPLVDPLEIDKLNRFFVENQCDFATNTLGRFTRHIPGKEDSYGGGLPEGVGAEVFTFEALRAFDQTVHDPYHREHVTTPFAEYSEKYRTMWLAAAPELNRPDFRLDVDYAEDLKFIQALTNRLPDESGPLWTTKQIIETLSREPELLEMRRDNSPASIE